MSSRERRWGSAHEVKRTPFGGMWGGGEGAPPGVRLTSGRVHIVKSGVSKCSSHSKYKGPPPVRVLVAHAREKLTHRRSGGVSMGGANQSGRVGSGNTCATLLMSLALSSLSPLPLHTLPRSPLFPLSHGSCSGTIAR